MRLSTCFSRWYARIASMRSSARTTGTVSPAVSRLARYLTGMRNWLTSGISPLAADVAGVGRGADRRQRRHVPDHRQRAVLRVQRQRHLPVAPPSCRPGSLRAASIQLSGMPSTARLRDHLRDRSGRGRCRAAPGTGRDRARRSPPPGCGRRRTAARRGSGCGRRRSREHTVGWPASMRG